MSLTSTFRAFAFLTYPYCQYCNKKLCYSEGDCSNSPDNNATCDHSKALANGGKDRWNNFILSCQGCNHDKDNQDWSHKPIHGPTNWCGLWDKFLKKHIKKTYTRKGDYRKVVRTISKKLKKKAQEIQKRIDMSKKKQTKKDMFMETITDTVSNLLYYDRKNDEELHYDDVDALIESGEVSLQEMVDAFSKAVLSDYPNIKLNP